MGSNGEAHERAVEKSRRRQGLPAHIDDLPTLQRIYGLLAAGRGAVAPDRRCSVCGETLGERRIDHVDGRTTHREPCEPCYICGEPIGEHEQSSLRRQGWKHRNHPVLTDDDRQAIVEAWRAGEASKSELADRYEVTRDTVRHVLRRHGALDEGDR